MPDVPGAAPVVLYGYDADGNLVPLKLNADGTLESTGGLSLGSTPSTQAIGDAAAGGSDTTASKNDHKHGMPSFGGAGAAVGTAAAGVATTLSRSDHVHNIPDSLVTSRMVDLEASIANVATSQTTTSTSYTDLATVGPAVTLSPGITQDHLITVSCFTFGSGAAPVRTRMGISVAGAAATVGLSYGQTGADETIGSRTHLATGQTSGATHTAKYKTDSGTATFSSREIHAMAL